MKKGLPIIQSVVFVSCVVLFGQINPDPVQVLIITGQSDLPYHLWRETTKSMKDILEASGRFEVRVTEEPRGLSESALEGYDVLLLNYNGPRWPSQAEEAIEAFIRKGGGFIAVHQASYGAFFGQVIVDGRWQEGEQDSVWLGFERIVGAKWAPEDIGHARRTVFKVDWKDTGHPVSSGLPESFMANDELYHKLQLSQEVMVLAAAESPLDLGGTGKVEPLVWTNRFGSGRVLFTTLGHDSLAWHEPGMANLLARGAEWAATGQVTIRPVSRVRHQPGKSDLRLLVVTGGHSYPLSFYAMLDSLPDVDWRHAATQEEAFGESIRGRFNVVLLHDMHDVTTEKTRKHLREYVEGGGGIVSMHHAIVDYSDWPWWFEEVTGGKYFVTATKNHPASHFKEDVEYLVSPVRGKEGHPVLKGVGPLWVYDETYSGMYHSPGIEVIMETKHEDNDRPVVYVGPYGRARVIYIQLGHSDDTMKNPGFRRLVSNAVQWVAGPLAK